MDERSSGVVSDRVVVASRGEQHGIISLSPWQVV